jgi:hypothetical protein
MTNIKEFNSMKKIRNRLAMWAWAKTGAGPHRDKSKYNRKKKHKNKTYD